jgi:Fe-Mn family superoxide dismutase
MHRLFGIFGLKIVSLSIVPIKKYENPKLYEMKTTNSNRFFKSTLVLALAATTFVLNPMNSLANSDKPFTEKETVNKKALTFAQEPLGYAYNDLEPYIDARTMEIHYSKHHAAYVTNVNDAIAQENITFSSVEEFFANASKLSAKARNNGGGAWNHTFFWKSLRPAVENNAPKGELLIAIEANFGSFDQFKAAFAAAASSRFGSGWAWLVKDGNQLKITSTPNQDNPLMDVAEVKGTPLLGLDVWEHAYYLHYQNKRADYITNWWNVVNWDFVASQFSK